MNSIGGWLARKATSKILFNDFGYIKSSPDTREPDGLPHWPDYEGIPDVGSHYLELMAKFEQKKDVN